MNTPNQTDYDVYVAKEDVDKLVSMALTQQQERLIQRLEKEKLNAGLLDKYSSLKQRKDDYNEAIDDCISIIKEEDGTHS